MNRGLMMTTSPSPQLTRQSLSTWYSVFSHCTVCTMQHPYPYHLRRESKKKQIASSPGYRYQQASEVVVITSCLFPYVVCHHDEARSVLNRLIQGQFRLCYHCCRHWCVSSTCFPFLSLGLTPRSLMIQEGKPWALVVKWWVGTGIFRTWDLGPGI